MVSVTNKHVASAADAEDFMEAVWERVFELEAEGRDLVSATEIAMAEANAQEGRPAVARGRLGSTNETDFVIDDVYCTRYAELIAQGLEHEYAHEGAKAKAIADADLRKAGFYARPLRQSSASATRMPSCSTAAANDNAPPKAFDATPFKFRDKSLIPRRQWLLGKFALRQEVSITVAPGGVGKSALSHMEAIALASDRGLPGFDVPKPLRVWIWNGEEPIEEMERRIRAITEHYGVSEADIGDRLFVDTEDTVELVLCEQTRNMVELKWPVIDSLVEVLKRRKIDIMIVDPFVTTHNCTENDNNAMEKAAKAWKTVAKRANCAIHLVHHTRKSNGQVITSDSSRGGDAVVSKARAVRALNPLSVKDAKKMGLSRQEGASIFYHDPSGNKVNMVGRGGACEWFKIVSVPLYNQTIDEEDVGDEIGVVTRWVPPESAALSYDEDALALFKAELALGFYLCTPQSQDNQAWVGHVIARCFEFPEDPQGQWKARAKAMWEQLVDDGEVRPSKERNPQHQERTVGRPIYASDRSPSDWEPSEH